MNSDALAARIENLLGSSPSSSAEKIPSRPPPPIPDHDIIARIGAGSYGEVWLARSVTGALRAVKVVWRCHFSSERPYEREFHGIVQFEPISRSHPGVVNVLHVGRDDAAGCFFYVMELADDANAECGTRNAESSPDAASSIPRSALRAPRSYAPRTLAADLKSRARLPVTDAVSLGVQLAGALGHLHRHGLVHRDVKPSNVIFVHGQPKLADIGLVTGVHEERSFVGTEGFIPPEGPGSERADLFALGRLLYEAATGKNRCDFPGLADDLDRWPKSEREALIELNEVLARACAPEAKKRHSNAAELAGDLNLILAGRSVRRAYRIERQLRQATLVSIAALVLVFAVLFSNWFQRRQREQSEARARREATLREEAEKSLSRAEVAELKSQQQLYTALLEQARATVLTGERGQRLRALEAVRRAAAISNSAALRGVAVAALALPDLRFERELPVAPDMTLVQLDPAFDRIALCRASGPVEIRSASDDRLLVTLPASTNKPVYKGWWSRDGKFFALCRDYDANRTKDTEVWNVARTNRVLLLRNSPWGAVSFHPQLPRIMVADASGAAVIWNLESGRELTRHHLTPEAVALQYSPDGEQFAVLQRSGGGSIISVFRAEDGTRMTSHAFSGSMFEFNWHPSGRCIAVPERSGAVYLVNAQTGDARIVGKHNADASHAVFSPDGKCLFSGGWDRELFCWDVNTLRRVLTAGLDSYKIQFRADGGQCAILRWPEVRLQLHTFEPPALCRGFDEDLGNGRTQAAFSADGRWLAASGADRFAIWNLNSDSAGVVVQQAWQTRISFASNGELFADRPGACFRWQLAVATNGGPVLTQLEMTKPARFFSLCLLPDAAVFTSSNGSKLIGFDQLAGEHSDWKPTIEGYISASPDGQWLAIHRPYSLNLNVYRLPGFELVATLTNETRIGRFEFSPRGDEIAISSRSGVALWSTITWQRSRRLTNFISAMYSRDAQSLWLTTDSRSSGLYDARTLELLLPLPSSTQPLALSRDGHHLAVTPNSRHVQVWDLVEVRLRLGELGLDWRE
jgi:serine/threonine protein kinase/WD40 repeat protein